MPYDRVRWSDTAAGTRDAAIGGHFGCARTVRHAPARIRQGLPRELSGNIVTGQRGCTYTQGRRGAHNCAISLYARASLASLHLAFPIEGSLGPWARRMAVAPHTSGTPARGGGRFGGTWKIASYTYTVGPIVHGTSKEMCLAQHEEVRRPVRPFDSMIESIP